MYLPDEKPALDADCEHRDEQRNRKEHYVGHQHLRDPELEALPLDLDQAETVADYVPPACRAEAPIDRTARRTEGTEWTRRPTRPI